MSIVVRLRTTADAARIGEVTPPPDLFIAAADEIERLNRDVEFWKNERDVSVNHAVTFGPEIAKRGAEIERLQADNRRWSKVADERSKENCALRQENERLLALTTRLRTAAESVCWFDWSNNDRDAVEAITELRLALEQEGDKR